MIHVKEPDPLACSFRQARARLPDGTKGRAMTIGRRSGGGPAPAGQGETVLVAEDDPRVRTLVLRRLAGLGYRALEAADGPEALRRLGDVPGVDLLLTDLAMPGGMSGLDLLRHARELRPGLPAVLTSGDAGPDGLRDGLAAQAPHDPRPRPGAAGGARRRRLARRDLSRGTSTAANGQWLWPGYHPGPAGRPRPALSGKAAQSVRPPPARGRPPATGTCPARDAAGAPGSSAHRRGPAWPARDGDDRQPPRRSPAPTARTRTRPPRPTTARRAGVGCRAQRGVGRRDQEQADARARRAGGDARREPRQVAVEDRPRPGREQARHVRLHAERGGAGASSSRTGRPPRTPGRRPGAHRPVGSASSRSRPPTRPRPGLPASTPWTISR